MVVGGDKVPYFRRCPKCGANLDPNERCDCGIKKAQEKQHFEKHTYTDFRTGKLMLRFRDERRMHKTK